MENQFKVLFVTEEGGAYKTKVSNMSIADLPKNEVR